MTGDKKHSPRKPTLLSVAKQAKKAGIEVARYEISGEKIVVVTTQGDSADVTNDNPWDTLLSGNGRPDGS